MVDEIQELPKKPSFFASVASGIGGFIKGTLAGGFMGVIGGGLIGALAIAVGAIMGGPLTIAAVGASALLGATIGASALATVGAAAGTMTSVVRSREAGQPTAEDVVNVAKISFAQGVSVSMMQGAALAQQQPETTHNRDKLAAQRAGAMAASQVIN